MKPLCVIPARRASKRLPLKNILPLAGKPMLAYSIEAAWESQLFDKIFVSTEDDQIASIANSYGAHVHPRPFELAGDLVSATDVCIDVYEACQTAGYHYKAIICLQPSSPLRTARDISEAWEKFCSSKADFLVSVTQVDPHYFHWVVHQENEWWKMFFGSRYMMERPLLPSVYRPNGSIKIGRVDILVEQRNFFGPRLVVYETPEERSIHVATQFDFDVAEYLLLKRKNGLEMNEED